MQKHQHWISLHLWVLQQLKTFLLKVGMYMKVQLCHHSSMCPIFLKLYQYLRRTCQYGPQSHIVACILHCITYGVMMFYIDQTVDQNYNTRNLFHCNSVNYFIISSWIFCVADIKQHIKIIPFFGFIHTACVDTHFQQIYSFIQCQCSFLFIFTVKLLPNSVK